MSQSQPIQIAGGGLAGLALGIGLRRHEIPVTVHEAAHYPRHRVCGEFIYGHGLDTLKSFGLHDRLHYAGARIAKSVAFHDRGRSVGPLALPSPAVCLSRFTLDHLLAEEFRRLGGDLREGSRMERNTAEGIVWASGRRSTLNENGWRWFGLKAHARGVNLAADLDLYFLEDAYVGLCRVEGDIVNVCGLFRGRTSEPELATRWRERLRGPPGGALDQRLAGAEFDPATFRAVAGLSLLPSLARNVELCCLGDHLTMIPPMTGNGMSMAIESARLALPPLVEFSRGQRDWRSACHLIARRCDDEFAPRLRWSGWLHRGFFQPTARRMLLGLAAVAPWLWRIVAARTR